MPSLKNKLKKPATRLIFAASEQDANLYWATGFLAPDPVIFIQHHNKKYLILNDLELDRGRKEAKVNQVLSYAALEKKTKAKNGNPTKAFDIIAHFLHQKKVKEVGIPYNFPVAYEKALRKKKLKPIIIPEPFYPNRLIKTTKEKVAIKKSLKITSDAIQTAYQALKVSKIKKNRIYYQGQVLTSERLRSIINLKLMEYNCLGKHTIVACGNQSVDPHCEGHGPLKPHQPIIMDVFPKSMDTQYFADMTRTVVKGKASEAFRRQWNAVKYAQEHAIKKLIKAGQDGKKVHDWINEYFDEKGYKTGVKNGRMQGFFHGTGHGLGLDIHEAPRVSRVSEILKTGNVITVEPGLYYQATGGVRIEDVVFVNKTGCEALSKCPKILEIP